MVLLYPRTIESDEEIEVDESSDDDNDIEVNGCFHIGV